MKEVFTKYGKIEKCRLVRDIGELIIREYVYLISDLSTWNCLLEICYEATHFSLVTVVTGRSKGYGFVEFKHLRDAEDAYNVSPTINFGGHALIGFFVTIGIL